jgi:hypothetical protein
MLAHLAAIAAGLAVIILVSAAWIVHLRLGPRLDGWVAGPMIIGVPFVLLVTGAAWLVMRAILQRWRPLTALSAVLVATLTVYAAMTVTCGGPFACLMPGPNRMLGWFVLAGIALFALVHHIVLTRMRGGA